VGGCWDPVVFQSVVIFLVAGVSQLYLADQPDDLVLSCSDEGVEDFLGEL
jgi:hypothetical protein